MKTLRDRLGDKILKEDRVYRKDGSWCSTIFTIKCSNNNCNNLVKVEKRKDIGKLCRSCSSKKSIENGHKKAIWTNCTVEDLDDKYKYCFEILKPNVLEIEQCKSYSKFRFLIKCNDCGKEFKSSDSNRTNTICSSCINKKRPYERAFNKHSRKVRKRSDGFIIQWKLNYEEFVELCNIKSCHYCNIDLNRAKYQSDKGSISLLLDRKDSDDHYTSQNCVPCCPRCNDMKGQHLTYDEMIMIAKSRGWIT
jgi:hypothetical protein